MPQVEYQLVRPEKVVARGKAWGIILPTGEINMTVIAGQVPGIVKTVDGIVQILPEEGADGKKYFVRRGIATIAKDKCTLACEEIIPFDKANYEQAVAKEEQDEFYHMVAEELRVTAKV